MAPTSKGRNIQRGDTTAKKLGVYVGRWVQMPQPEGSAKGDSQAEVELERRGEDLHGWRGRCWGVGGSKEYRTAPGARLNSQQKKGQRTGGFLGGSGLMAGQKASDQGDEPVPHKGVRRPQEKRLGKSNLEEAEK